MLYYYKVILNLPFFRSFTYSSDKILEVGEVVQVPFGKIVALGIVTCQDYAYGMVSAGRVSNSLSYVESEDLELEGEMELADDVFCQDDGIKAIEKTIGIKLSNNLIKLIEFTANYTISPIGMVLKLALPFKTFTKPTKVESYEELKFNLKTLSPMQGLAVGQMLLNQFAVYLLHGKTGSGKTEVYLHKVAEVLRDSPSSQVLIMLPEIGLTGELFTKLQTYFGKNVVLWNSSVGEAKKRRFYLDVASGRARIVLGTRSALFLPFKDLKLIVIDEEHDQSYKQEEVILYNARDMAIVRAVQDGVPVILASATPSVESQYNCLINKYKKIVLTERFFEVEMPQVELVNLKQNKLLKNSQFCQQTIDEIDRVLKKGKQVLIFCNRRGYAPIIMCSDCCYRFNCHSCDVFLTYHKFKKKLVCHQCGSNKNVPAACPACGKTNVFREIGFGVEKISEEISNHFMFVPKLMLSSDTLTTPKKLEEAIEQIKNNHVQVIIGTQIVSKGFHFKDIELVCILDGDFGSNSIDFRGKEKTYQLITQVGGRAGREGDRGKVLIQTYNPEDKVLNAIKDMDEDGFYTHQIQTRQTSLLPPFVKQISIIISSRDKLAGLGFAKTIIKELSNIFIKVGKSVEVLGPAEAQIFYIKKKFRYRVLLSFDKNTNPRPQIINYIQSINIPHSISIKFDADPFSFF
jgi:primosomal protein N' (replication factor Y) (superfamily II helicase)